MILEQVIEELRNNRNFQALEGRLAEIKAKCPDGIGLRFKVCDDIDFDGVTIAYILTRQLKRLFPFAKVDVFNNNKHGILRADIEDSNKYTMVFIGDSSTNLVQEYVGLLSTIVVIDHHEVTTDIASCPSNVILINSKLIKGLESVSAGALAYILCKASTWFNDSCDATLKMAVASCYSDIVPADKLVQELIDLAFEDDQDDVVCKLNVYNHPITKTNLQYSIIPTVNYTRRLQDNNVLKSIIMGKFNSIVIDKLLNNKTVAMKLLRRMEELAPVYQLCQYSYIGLYDITKMKVNLDIGIYPYENFKGVLANRLADKYKIPTVVGYMKDAETFYASFRSPEIDTLTFLEQFNLVGGGHKPACGFEIPINRFDEIFDAYNLYCQSKKVDMSKYSLTALKSLDELPTDSLFKIALTNEYAYSDRKIIAFYIDHLSPDIQKVRDTDGGFIFDDVHYKTAEFVEVNTPYILVPTLTAYQLKRFVLQINKCER